MKQKITEHTLKIPETQEKYQEAVEKKVKELKVTDNIEKCWIKYKKIKEMIKDKKKKWSKYLESRNEISYETYRESRRKVTKRIKERKQIVWEKFGNIMK